jgi:glycerol kinase
VLVADFVLAIDQGTTGSTAVVVGPDGTVRGRATTEFRQHFPRPGWVEHDPDDLWRSCVTAAGRALDVAGLGTRDVAALGITNQRETTVLWDRATGRPVAPAVVWQDRRTAAACRRLREDGHEKLIRARTGLLPDPYFSATKIAWLLDAVPDGRRRASRGELAAGTVDSWLLHVLSGGRVHTTDVTNASRTMLMDLSTTGWDPELLDLLDVPVDVLPDIAPSGQFFAETAPAVFLDARLPITGVLGDQQAALFAQGCFQPGQAKNTYGTGSFVLMNTGAGEIPDQRDLLATVAVGLAGEPVQYALEGSIFVTGAAVQWLRDGLGVIEQAADTADLAAGLPGNDDVYFVPALTGLGAPHWDPYARGMLIGLTRGTTVAHLARAALESMAYQSADVVAAMSARSGWAIDELRVDGGAAVNSWLMQFQADVLGIPVDVPVEVETTALGSAHLAGLIAGVWQDRGELQRRRRTAQRYEPRLPAADRGALLGRWREAVSRARGWSLPEPGDAADGEERPTR